MKDKWNVLLPIVLMLVFALTRWPGLMPENFSAAYALAFCAGVYFPASLVWWLPLGTLLVSDICLNLFHYEVAAVSPYMLVNYGAFAVLIGLGRLFKPNQAWWKLLGGGLAGAIVFYLISNTAAWLQNPGYAKTLAGWFQALSSGIPGYPPTWAFFRNTLLSGGLFTGLFVGAMKLTTASESEEEEESEPEEEAGDKEPAPAGQ